MAPEIFSLGQTAISAHAFNADRTRMLLHGKLSSILLIITEVVVSLNSNEAQIFSRRGSEWVPTETLAEVTIAAVLYGPDD